MVKVMDKMVGECQNTFVEERQILDAVPMTNEVVDDLLISESENRSYANLI